MKIFCTLILTVIIAIVVERCRVDFLLVEIDDAAGKDLKHGSDMSARMMQDRSEMMVKRDCAWETWSPWSHCTTVCNEKSTDLGCSKCTKARSRNRHPEEHGGKPCDGKGFEESECTNVEYCAARKVCNWFGRSPFCAGDCPSGWVFDQKSKCGDGACCWQGHKNRCCQTQWFNDRFVNENVQVDRSINAKVKQKMVQHV